MQFASSESESFIVFFKVSMKVFFKTKKQKWDFCRKFCVPYRPPPLKYTSYNENIIQFIVN